MFHIFLYLGKVGMNIELLNLGYLGCRWLFFDSVSLLALAEVSLYLL